ncbi:MAG: DUF969 domain-containing protein [Opitutus sp.]|nr:DUF969 domain-containing protein [Opitutus sp.]
MARTRWNLRGDCGRNSGPQAWKLRALPANHANEPEWKKIRADSRDSREVGLVIKLLGIVLIAVGFALRWNALLVVTAAGIATGLLAGFSWREIVQMTGQFFVDNRALTLPVIILVPVVGLLERHGLQQHVAALMRRAKAATAGRVLWLYQFVRELTSMFGMSIGNHASMVRPLIVPMSESAAQQAGQLDDAAGQKIRAHAAAAENVGNFFADDIFVAIGALLLIKGFFDAVGVKVSLEDIKLWSAPTAVWVLAVGWWRYRTLDAQLRRDARKKEAPPP